MTLRERAESFLSRASNDESWINAESKFVAQELEKEFEQAIKEDRARPQTPDEILGLID